jgi:hypothetical protein
MQRIRYVLWKKLKSFARHFDFFSCSALPSPPSSKNEVGVAHLDPDQIASINTFTLLGASQHNTALVDNDLVTSPTVFNQPQLTEVIDDGRSLTKLGQLNEVAKPKERSKKQPRLQPIDNDSSPPDMGARRRQRSDDEEDEEDIGDSPKKPRQLGRKTKAIKPATSKRAAPPPRQVDAFEHDEEEYISDSPRPPRRTPRKRSRFRHDEEDSDGLIFLPGLHSISVDQFKLEFIASNGTCKRGVIFVARKAPIRGSSKTGKRLAGLHWKNWQWPLVCCENEARVVKGNRKHAHKPGYSEVVLTVYDNGRQVGNMALCHCPKGQNNCEAVKKLCFALDSQMNLANDDVDEVSEICDGRNADEVYIFPA